ncbi:MAG: ABC transporter permease [Alphaproteobacteria bacterium]|nr:ABC transporter permease [Alphaproteobacteria bacterium]
MSKKILFFGSFLFVWQGACDIFHVPAYSVPSPWTILVTLVSKRNYLLFHFSISFIEIVYGLFIGVALALITALTFDRVRSLESLLMPYLIMLKNLPIFVLAPLLLLWCGHGIGPKAFLIGLSSYFPMAVGLSDGLKQCPRDIMDFLTTLHGRSWSRTLFWVRFPFALPSFITGCRLAFIHAPLSVIACDWIGASSGLGYVLMLCYGRLDLPLMFAALILLVMMSVLFYSMARRLDTSVTNKLKLRYL